MKFGAVYCIYDDHEYLEISVNSIKKFLDKTLFLISDVPWNGKKSDNSKTIEFVKNLCKQNKNFELIQGHWTNEVDQRNFGLEKFYSENIDYYFVIDSDEIYHEQHFKNIINVITQNPSFSAFHIEWNTYWTKRYYVISPREYYKPLIVVKVNNFLFTTIRHGTTNVIRTKEKVFVENKDSYNYALIPNHIAICYHLSYARTDDYIKRKLETNSHAPEFISNWYEKTWKTWSPKKTDLHPVTPNQYKIEIKEKFNILPDELKLFIKNENQKKCTIVILNWNSKDYLKRCLELINKNTKIEHEIIIVDNGSKDDSVEFLKTLENVKIIYNKDNLGFAPAVNQAIRIADKNTDICLMNVDAEPQENWLEELYNTLRTNANAGIIGPLGN
jgi:glycosyltransferase involved in cell wall biosynthesis